MTLSPLGALVVVLANALVLFLFSSEQLAVGLSALGLPPLPLVPVSSSQAVIGAVLGLGLLQGGRGLRQIRWGVLLRIASGWVTTPLLAAVLGFVLLFVVQNVFGQQVVKPVAYQLTPPVLQRLQAAGLPVQRLQPQPQPVADALHFRAQLRQQLQLTPSQEQLVLKLAARQP
jgi:PiT family inorganic phosphate transporter